MNYLKFNSVKISIIVTCFNDEKNIRKCLNSLIHQSFNNIEIICVDCGSTDDSLLILNDFGKLDSRIKIFSIKKNSFSHARNVGLKSANGEFISFINASDWIELNFYEKLYFKAVELNSDILFFKLVNYDSISDDYFCPNINFMGDFLKQDISIDKIILKNLLFNLDNEVISKFYKKNILIENNITFLEKNKYDNNIFLIEYIINSKNMGYVDNISYFKNVVNKNNLLSFDDYCENIIYINEFISLFFEKNIFDLFKINLVNYSFSFILDCLIDIPLYYADEFFLFLKNNFFGFSKFRLDFISNLTRDNIHYYNLFNEEYYLDFIHKFNMHSINYEILLDSKKDNYKVTVIIPFYKRHDKFIHRNLMSIINQSMNFKNIEILLIDFENIPFDNIILNKYLEKFDNFKIIHLKSSIDAIQNNVGFYEASGEYVIFSDYFHFFEINALEELYNKIVETNSDIVFGNYVNIKSNDPSVVKFDDILQYKDSYINYSQIVSFSDDLLYNSLFNRKFLIGNNIDFIFDLNDSIFLVNAFKKAMKIRYLSNLIVCFEDLDMKYDKNISFDDIISSLFCEKFLLNRFWHNNEEYFNDRGDIFNSILQSLFDIIWNIDQINIFLKFFQFFLEKYAFPNIHDEKLLELFDYILKKDVDSIFNLLNSDDSFVNFEYDLPNVLNEYECFSELDVFNNSNIHDLIKEKSNCIIEESKLFDEGFYLQNYPDVKLNSINPVNHFLKLGLIENCNPNSYFDLKWYYDHYIDVKLSDLNPFIHYILIGQFENRLTNSELFNSKFLPLDDEVINNITDALNQTISIIVPVFNAFDSFKLCIESIFQHTDLNYELIIIDDHSDDARISKFLETISHLDNVSVIFNEKNEGYVKNVNKGMRKSNHDVILLNSDTIVTHKWIQKLVIAAYSDNYVGTVTPVSNNAGAFSVPEFNENIIPKNLGIEYVANLVEKISSNFSIEVPTGNGFCMFIKRDTLNSVGYFDDITFFRGYGEENDFCIRSNEKGWINIIDDSTYIFHERSASFNEEKNSLIQQHLFILKNLYPEYSNNVQKFLNSKLLKIVKNNINDGLSKPVKIYKKRIIYFSNNTFNLSIFDLIQRYYDCFIVLFYDDEVCIYKYVDFKLQIIERFSYENKNLYNIQFNIVFNLKIDLFFINKMNKLSYGALNIANSLKLPVFLHLK